MNELAKIEPMPVAVSQPTTPQALMRRATDVAGVCREIVLKTACEIQGRKFVRVEGWESIATAHGCFVGAEDAKRAYDNAGNHIGYEAKAIMRNSYGEIIATGEGFVGFDERDRKGNATWKNRAEYAGRAMAQTRSISRVCRSVFAHVVVLIDAGLSTTPAEEVPDGGFDDDQRASKAKPERASKAKPVKQAARPAANPMATPEQQKRWVSLLKPLGQAALDYAYEQKWLLPPAQDFPGEPIEMLSLTHVPATKKQADAILAAIQARMDNQPQPPSDKPSDAPQGSVERSTASQEPSRPQFDEEGNPIEQSEPPGFANEDRAGF